MNYNVHLVLHPRGIAPNFSKLDSWSQGAGFIPIISTKGINQIKKKIYYILKNMDAIPRLPEIGLLYEYIM